MHFKKDIYSTLHLYMCYCILQLTVDVANLCVYVRALTVCVRVDSGSVQRRTVQGPALWREERTSTPLMEKCTLSMGTALMFWLR